MKGDSCGFLHMFDSERMVKKLDPNRCCSFSSYFFLFFLDIFFLSDKKNKTKKKNPNSTQRDPPQPTCRAMVKHGVCREPDCPYKHTTEDIKECNMYRLGFCVYGPTCRYKHTRLPGPPPDPSTLEAARPRDVRNVNAVVNSVNIGITAPRMERVRMLKAIEAGGGAGGGSAGATGGASNVGRLTLPPPPPPPQQQ